MLTKIENLPSWLTDAADRNQGTLWQAVKAYRANLRQGTVGVLTRAMVRATGKKPYSQKGMGRARRGSMVGPSHVGGGVAHGPKMRDYRQALPKKMARLALRIALAKRIQSGDVFAGDLVLSDAKTKNAVALLAGVLSPVGKTIVCLKSNDESALLAYRNVRGVVLKAAKQLNALDVMVARRVVFADDALASLAQRFGSQAK